MSEDRSIDPAGEHACDPVGEPSFLRRWSERKARARQPDPQPVKGTEPVSPAPVLELTDADMPPLASLDEKSDYSLFFSPKVSSGLRRAALRKLFHSPAYNVVDKLCDYSEDFTCFAELGEVITQDRRHRLEVEARRLAESVLTADQPAAAQVKTAVAARDSETAAGEVVEGDSLTAQRAHI